MQFSEAFVHFITFGQGEKGYAKETVAKHRDCFRSWLLPVFSELDPARLTSGNVANLQSAMVNRGLSVARRYSVRLLKASPTAYVINHDCAEIRVTALHRSKQVVECITALNADTAFSCRYRPGAEVRWLVNRHAYLQADYGIFTLGNF